MGAAGLHHETMTAGMDIIHAYRHLYRGLLRAVQFSSPARYVARDQLRAAFRETGAAWDAEGAKRTLWFVQAAARERGLEHRVLKNLLRVRLLRAREGANWRRRLHESKQRNDMKAEQETAFEHYDMTVAMLNKSMGLRLR
ncbi:complex 1 protein (LYR family) domain-containing protein [Purpureocillium lavendulum]|uniref:Complex 1 protein (LYR family) domain-containing protein n=1 Tax=Purpureocillium lavendulum TaxID=1247861 RepID=A0AB34FUX2_9HYPO|nr:complex 1 protein (LYR family) domain-containing protein [Purpureocillium lavendulum]